MILSLMIFLPIIGALVTYLIGIVSEKASKAVTLLVSAFTVVLTLFIFTAFNWSVTGFQFTETYDWAKSFGLTYSVGVDGISLPLLIIASSLTALSAAGSLEQINTKIKEYNALLLLFEGAVIGVFTSLNLVAFYVFWELVLIPMFFFIGVWGGPRKKYAAMKFLIMTHVGSILVLLSFITLYVMSTPHSFNFTDLVTLHLPITIQILISLGFFIGFGVKLPIVPFHTWLPDAHVEAPAPISVLLAGVLLKMGGYGFIRMNLFLMPEASKVLAPLFIGFGLLTMFYGALVAMVQQDLKRMIALTSINHMGYVLLGAFTLTTFGVTGAVFQMVNHAFAVGALFLMSGVIHEHMGTRTIRELSGFAKAMPKTSVLLVLSSLAAMGFPGFGNFISEYVIILAGISINLFYAIAVLVPGITAGYFVWMLRRVLMSPKEGGVGGQREAPYYTLLTLAAFLVPLLIFGLYPAPLWGIISSTVKAVPGLFQP